MKSYQHFPVLFQCFQQEIINSILKSYADEMKKIKMEMYRAQLDGEEKLLGRQERMIGTERH